MPVKPVQYANVFSKISVTLFGISKSPLKPEQLSKEDSYNLSNFESGPNSNFDKLEQPLKQFSLIDVTSLGITNVPVRPEQPKKVDSSNIVRLFDKTN